MTPRWAPFSKAKKEHRFTMKRENRPTPLSHDKIKEIGLRALNKLNNDIIQHELPNPLAPVTQPEDEHTQRMRVIQEATIELIILLENSSNIYTDWEQKFQPWIDDKITAAKAEGDELKIEALEDFVRAAGTIHELQVGPTKRKA